MEIEKIIRTAKGVRIMGEDGAIDFDLTFETPLKNARDADNSQLNLAASAIYKGGRGENLDDIRASLATIFDDQFAEEADVTVWFPLRNLSQ